MASNIDRIAGVDLERSFAEAKGASGAANSDLIISEIVEGSSLNKAVELYNGTDAEIDLALEGYQILIYFNGSTSPGTAIDLTGTIAPGETFVLADDGAVLGITPDQTSAANFFNGDDAIVLRRGDVVVDSFGQAGVDPGSEWPGGGQNDTLRRVTAPDEDPSDAFDAGAQWTVGPQDDFSDLGQYAGAEPQTADKVFLSEIVVTPTGGEFIEIHNPGADAIDLSNLYLTDATFAGGGTYYYNLPTGANAGGGGFADFLARFPAGASIAAGEYLTISLAGSAEFLAEYGFAPDFELFDDGSNDGEAVMREALPGSINGQGGLTNSGEVVVLFEWDGQSDLVADHDYFVWGDKAEAVDKTGTAVDGPDAGTDPTAYLPDTPIVAQDVASGGAHPAGSSFQRVDLGEGTQTASGGNGVTGADETSENLSQTWSVLPATPGAAAPGGGDATIVINEIHADPAGDIAGDANGDGARDASEDEFVEIVNSGDEPVDLGGAALSDGVGVRHVFADGTTLAPGAAIVVFGGGAPTGEFGGAQVVTASSGALGLNNGGDSVTLTSADGATVIASASYGGEGGDNQSLTRDPELTGDFVKHTTVASALYSPGTAADGAPFAAGEDDVTLISAVQGPGRETPLAGRTVTVEAIVVGDYQDGDGVYGDLNGFYLQEEDADADGDPMTSEGLFVFDGSSAAVDVSLGDKVRVTGVAGENFGQTQISDVMRVQVVSSDTALPTAAEIVFPVATLVDGVADLEMYEGMRVTIPQEMTVGDIFNLGRFGEIDLNALGRVATYTQINAPDVAGFEAYYTGARNV